MRHGLLFTESREELAAQHIELQGGMTQRGIRAAGTVLETRVTASLAKAIWKCLSPRGQRTTKPTLVGALRDLPHEN